MILLVLIIWSFIVLGEPRPTQRDAESSIVLQSRRLPRVNVTGMLFYLLLVSGASYSGAVTLRKSRLQGSRARM